MPMIFPPDYAERVYAGVLGKIIGVYLGRPFEGWTHEQIVANLGEIKYYVNDRQDLPLRNHQLVITDDDISGTFTFLRALPDYNNSLDLTPAQIGQTWLNYIIENRTILWWGGLGNSTEHTAFLRLKDGIPAPHSGSSALNGNVVAEQIGAQIFIDGWGLIAPGDPALAADLARRAASVSHDGEAIYGAQVIAALIAEAFIESDLDKLIDTATAFIPGDSIIYRLIADIRAWHAREPQDWYAARAKLAASYGYDKYGGNCHIIPNHGLVILSLLYSQGDFQRAQTIVNTCGWDTDCNAGNVGCILGVRNRLAAFEGGPDWRGPVADQLYLSTADGGRAISDALRETDFILEIAHAIRGERWIPPKGGARFHFSLPGSVQGFRSPDQLKVENTSHPTEPGQRVLTLRYHLQSNVTVAASTPTFIPSEAIEMPGYSLFASPTLYPGQIVHAALFAAESNPKAVEVGIQLQSYGYQDKLVSIQGPPQILLPGKTVQLEWQVPDLDGAPIVEVGVFLSSDALSEGIVHLDYLSWDGSPIVTFRRPVQSGRMWKRQWVNAADFFEDEFGEAFRVVQNRGRGMVITGTREWTDYSVQALLTPHLAKAFGLAARVQGLERYYGLLLSNQNTIKLIKRLDGEILLAEKAFDWEFGQAYHLQITVKDNQILGLVDGALLFQVEDTDRPLSGGGIALVCEEGRIGTDEVSVRSE
ncbi:MAG TPA: ADP-ribosylglycohydrolase family protein [Anaerolineales bacterium]|nr:ADP-ribosylglycohydrolase family protein [Anaerolineales bacterium]